MGIFNAEYNDGKIEKTPPYSITYFESILMRINLFMEMPTKFIYKKKLIRLTDLIHSGDIHETLIPYTSKIGVSIYFPYLSGADILNSFSMKEQWKNIKRNTNYQFVTILNVNIGIDEEKIISISIGTIIHKNYILNKGIIKLKLNFTTTDNISNMQIYLLLHGGNLKPADQICVLFWGIKEL